MDHRISKDMISSGMIPSGEKNQEDLSKTQYGTVPSPNALADVYKKMYETKEEVINEHHKKDADGNTIPHEDEEIKEGKMPAGLQAYLDKKKGKKEDKKDMKEDYNLVYEHFIGEGFSEEETYERMSNLTEEQLDEFMKALATRAARYGASLGGNTPAPKQGPVVGGRMTPKPGDVGFKASSPSEVVKDVNLRKKEVATAKAKPLKDKMDSALTQLRAGSLKFGSTSQSEKPTEKPLKDRIIKKKFAEENVDEAGPLAALAPALKAVKTIAKSKAVQNIATQTAVNSAMNSGGEKTNKTGTLSASADLFDIVKGQLLDEGLSEEEIRDIMLTLTPDEIMSEMNAGPSTPVKNYGDSPDKPKILPNFGATRAKPRTTDKGTLIKGGKDTGKTAAQMSQEEYKNFDPKKPDPKQMAAQAKQEKNKQKFNDPMGVKNKNIGGQGLDPMDK